MIPGQFFSGEKMNNKYSFRDFLPLIIIFGVVLVATYLKVHLHWFGALGMSEIATHSFMTSFMAFFFIIFGGFKIFNLSKFAEAYAMYDLIAKRSRIYALAYPFIEFGLGLSYLFNWYPMITNTVTLILMCISAAGVAQALMKGNLIMCACLGAVFKIPMTYVTLAEDLLMAVMAHIMLIS